jgi:hypothetical protein
VLTQKRFARWQRVQSVMEQIDLQAPRATQRGPSRAPPVEAPTNIAVSAAAPVGNVALTATAPGKPHAGVVMDKDHIAADGINSGEGRAEP